MNLKSFTKCAFRAARSFVNRERPFFAHLFVTKRCNLHCKMCNVWETKCPEVDTAGMKQIIDRLDELGVAVVQLTGGEPFLRRDLGELVRYADAKGLVVQISTNGTLPVSIYQKALELPLDSVGVSLHSYQPSTHDRINGLPGSWKRAVQTIRLFRERNKNVYVCSVISPANIDETGDIVRFCTRDLHVAVGLQPAVIGSSSDDGYAFRSQNPELGVRLDQKKIDRVIAAIPLSYIRRTIHFMRNAFTVLAGDDPAWSCEGGRLFLAVMPDGQLGICQDILTDLNILDEDFPARYHSPEFRQSCRKKASHCKRCVYACYYDLHNIFRNPLEGLEMWWRNRRPLPRAV